MKKTIEQIIKHNTLEDATDKILKLVVKSDVNGLLPIYEDYKTEYQRRSECEFPHPTMKPHEAYMIGFNQCYNWIKREMRKGNGR